MANHKSALKRSKQNDLKRSRNRVIKSKVKNAVKEMRLAAQELPAEELAAKLNAVKSIIDKASKSTTLHKRSASRKISRLTKLANSVPA